MSVIDKLKVINSMPVVDYSVASGEVEYVVTKETDKKVETLREMRMTDDDYKQMTDDEGYLDLSYFAFNVLGAEYWNKKTGFSI
ncbi:hypothetical protein [Lederbergia galactosidilytica]|uniref:Uncharacterized protein n=1 Tax=Lederbergia galactosidilytica TaxID=217031 RepID=A0A177ZXK7_9BACI|nr:hypothetical protein [Lederbergia galactosidilytica]OAK72666.1 hypothetical protein ABB05_07355 [Lederbergia galactosidilytica]